MNRLLLLAIAPVLMGGDWPQFRGLNGSATSDEKNLPETFSETSGLRWKVDLPGRGVSCPIVVGSRVFLTAASGTRGDRLHVFCFDLKTGKTLWHRQMWATGSTFCHPDTNMAGPTPVADKDGVYALFACGDCAAFDNDGNLKWYRSLVGDYPDISNQLGLAASPVLYKDLLFVPMDNAGDSFFAALDTRYGQNIWKVARPRAINWVSPFIRETGETAEVLIASGDALTAYDVRSGAKQWEYKGGGINTIPSPFPAGEGILLPANGLTALRREGTETKELWKSAGMRTGMGSCVAYDGRVYGVNSQGVLVCVDGKTGEQKWAERLKGKFSSSPVAADGKIYVGNESGIVFVVKAGDEPEILAENKLGGRIQATPAVVDGCILYRTDAHLFCIGK